MKRRRIAALTLTSAMIVLSACGNTNEPKVDYGTAEVQEEIAETSDSAQETESVTETETETEEDKAQALVEEGLDYYYARNGQEVDNTKAFELFQEAADLGSAEAYYYLGNVYQKPEYQNLVNTDYAKSTEAYKKAAKMGYPLAEYELGNLYLYGHGVMIDNEKAKKHFQKAVSDGCMEANSGLGYLAWNGFDMEQDKAAAIDYYSKGTAGKEPGCVVSAYDTLAIIEEYGDSYQAGAIYDYDNEEGRIVDYSKVIEYLTKADELCTWSGKYKALLQSAYERSGDSEKAAEYQAQFEEWCAKAEQLNNARYLCDIADIFDDKRYLGNDESKVFDFRQKAAETGDIASICGLADCYLMGIGVEADGNAALAEFQKAADAGSSYAILQIGWIYKNGKAGVEQNFEKAFAQYSISADMGRNDSMNNLAVMYAQGAGVEQDYQKAAEWYKKAIDSGSIVAMSNYGYMYQNGEGVEQNDEEAVNWYKKAADLGDYFGMYWLGNCYFNGYVVEQSYEKALEWYEKALAQAEREHDQERIEQQQENIENVKSWME